MSSGAVQDSSKLFKYYRFNTQNINTVLRGEVFLAHPSMFNDPFDSMINAKGKDDEALKLISEYLIKNLDEFEADFCAMNDLYYRWGEEYYFDGTKTYVKGPKISESIKYFFNEYPQLFMKFKEQVISDEDSRFAEIKKYLQFTENIGVCAFSSIRDSESMWAYYADNHRGICVEYLYDQKRLSGDLMLQYVDYRPNEGFLEISGIDKHEFAQQVFIKNESWTKEFEICLVSQSRTRTSVKFPGEIVSITCGAFMPKHDQDICEKLFRDRPEVELYLSSVVNSKKRLERKGLRIDF